MRGPSCAARIGVGGLASRRCRLRALLATPLVALSCAGSEPSSRETLPSALPIALSQRVEIDGVPDFSIVERVEERGLSFFDSGGGQPAKATSLRWGMTNDDRDIYVAIEWVDDTNDRDFDALSGPQDYDGVSLVIDSDGDGRLEPGEDTKTVIAASVGSQYVDQHVGAPGQSDLTDLIGDGFGKLLWDARLGVYRAEFLFPISRDARNQDADLSAATRYNIVLFDHVRAAQGKGSLATLHPAVQGSAGWPLIPLLPATPHERPDLPQDLTGTIVFISEHESQNGEIYRFDPGTGQVARVTYAPDLFKDNVSLSHDGSRVAFHGAPSRTDVANFEIYVIRIDGTDLRQLTRNQLLDGHPGWSPDDSRIVYASFRDPGQASIVVMSAETGAEIADLTPPGQHGNDPDYLPDGRIVFKTDMFSRPPEVRIAVMSEMGGTPQQLTSVPGVSDHDPSGTTDRVLFERFPKSTDFGEDPEAGFVAWDLLEVRADGAGERVLLSDGWINWLPVFDPTRRYVAYQKSTGAYTAIHLVSDAGQELGRLVPDVTRVRYIDWK